MAKSKRTNPAPEQTDLPVSEPSEPFLTQSTDTMSDTIAPVAAVAESNSVVSFEDWLRNSPSDFIERALKEKAEKAAIDASKSKREPILKEIGQAIAKLDFDILSPTEEEVQSVTTWLHTLEVAFGLRKSSSVPSSNTGGTSVTEKVPETKTTKANDLRKGEVKSALLAAFKLQNFSNVEELNTWLAEYAKGIDSTSDKVLKALVRELKFDGSPTAKEVSDKVFGRVTADEVEAIKKQGKPPKNS